MRSDVVQEARQNKQHKLCLNCFKITVCILSNPASQSGNRTKIITIKIVTTLLVPADHSELIKTILIWQALYFGTKITSEMKAEVVKRLSNIPLFVV